MRPTVKVEVVWDGSRVYRVPSPGEIEAVELLSRGHGFQQASDLLGMHPEGAQRRAYEAQQKLRALSTAGALYQMYRLQLLPSPRDPDLEPLLNDRQLAVLDVTARMGLVNAEAHKALGIGKSTLVRRVAEIYELYGATNRIQALRRAVAHGDLEIQAPPQLWRGEV